MNEEELNTEKELDNQMNQDTSEPLETSSTEMQNNGVEESSNITEDTVLETTDLPETTVVTVEEVAVTKEPLPEIEIEKTEPTTILDNTSTIDVTDIEGQMEEHAPEIQEVKPKKKGKAKIVIPIILFLLVAAVAVWYFVFNNSKNLFLAAVNKEYNLLSNELDKLEKSSPLFENARKSSLVGKGTFKINATDNSSNAKCTGIAKCITDEPNEFDVLNKLSGNYTYGIDYKNKTISSTLKINYNEKELLNFGLYGENKNIYLEIKELLDKYVNVPFEEFDAIFEDTNTTYEDSKYLAETVKNAILESLDSKDFKQSNAEIFIGDKKVKTKKISYELTESKSYDLAEKVRVKILKDSKFIEKYAKLTGKTIEKAKKDFEKKIETKTSTSDEKIIFSIYNKGFENETVKFDIEIKTENENGVLSYTKSKDAKYFNITIGEDTSANITIKKIDEKASNIKAEFISGEDTTIINIDSVKLGKQTTYTYKMNGKDKSSEISGKLVVESNETEKEAKNKLDFDMTIKSGKDSLKFALAIADEAKVGEKVEMKAIGQTMTLDELSSLDMNSSLEKLANNEAFLELIKDLGIE
jgi:hypothetical protein